MEALQQLALCQRRSHRHQISGDAIEKILERIDLATLVTRFSGDTLIGLVQLDPPGAVHGLNMQDQYLGPVKK